MKSQLQVLTEETIVAICSQCISSTFVHRGILMKVGDITVELRLSQKPDSKVKAFADVTRDSCSNRTLSAVRFSRRNCAEKTEEKETKDAPNT